MKVFGNPVLAAMVMLLIIGVGAFVVGIALMRYLRQKLTK